MSQCRPMAATATTPNTTSNVSSARPGSSKWPLSRRTSSSPILPSTSSGSRGPSSMVGSLPLEGITVVSLEQAVAAPFTTRQLADLGARVIKVERPGVGDFARSYDETVKGLASHFVWLNRSKESLALDLRKDAAKD